MSFRRHGVRADEGFVLRTPLLPASVLLDWPVGGDLVAQRAYLGSIVARPDVSEAIFLASPGLHAAIEKWRRAPDSPAGRRVGRALVKYVARMAWRTTPFGLFAAISVGTLGPQTSFELAPRANFRRSTRLDNEYLFRLANELASRPAVRDALHWSPNTSLYALGGRLRHVEARLDGGERGYHLVAVERTPYLEATLARAAGGARPDVLARALVADDPTLALSDATRYVEDLIDQQLLVPDLGVQVTGPEPIESLLDRLAAVGDAEFRAVILAARSEMAALDTSGVGNDPARYRAIAAGIDALPPRLDESRLFQVDTVRPATATLSAVVASEIARTAITLAAIAPNQQDGALDAWKRAFVERWEEAEVALAEALDEESGIGFESASGPGMEGAPLLSGIEFPPMTPDLRVTWTRRESHLLRRLTAALEVGQPEIELDGTDIEVMKADRAAPLPDAFAALIRLGLGQDGQPEILFDTADGPSGARLLGRFCHASSKVHEMVEAHHRREEILRPDTVFAEIVHLDDARIGNVLCRPVLRSHEIVFLGLSGAAADRQITIEDLLVSVRDGRIILRSRRLDRQIVPRLSTAHNYRLRSLGVYRFLCALATQGSGAAWFTWGALGGASFLPRVRIGRVILSRAIWNLDESEIEAIVQAARGGCRPRAADDRQGPGADGRGSRIDGAEALDGLRAAVTELRRSRRLPRFVALVAGDNELPVDLDNPLLVEAFADEIAGKRSAQVTELFPAGDRLIARADDGSYTSEVIVTFTRTTPTSRVAPPVGRVQNVRRSFPPGSAWLYAKVYCGASNVDRVLRQGIAPVARNALANQDATHWFFVRYADPDSHVRVRFAGVPTRLVSTVLPSLESALAPLMDAAVHRVQLDTYVREVERYGGAPGIHLVERLFWIDSEAVVDLVDTFEGDTWQDARWRLALRGIDGLLASLGLDSETRATVVLRARDALGAEHRVTPRFWSQLGERFAREGTDLETLLGSDVARQGRHALAPGLKILARRDARIAELATELHALNRAGELSPRLHEMSRSLAHMHVNRLLHASQRAQEMVLYDYLRRLYATRRARPGRDECRGR